jgi:hypothetical protein
MRGQINSSKSFLGVYVVGKPIVTRPTLYFDWQMNIRSSTTFVSHVPWFYLIHMLVLKLFCLLATQSLKQHPHGSIPFNFLFENLYMPLKVLFVLYYQLKTGWWLSKVMAESRRRLIEFVDLRIKRSN